MREQRNNLAVADLEPPPRVFKGGYRNKSALFRSTVCGEFGIASPANAGTEWQVGVNAGGQGKREMQRLGFMEWTES